MGLFSQQSKGEYDGLTLGVDAAEDDDVPAEACLDQPLVEEDEVLVALVLGLHLWSLVEQVSDVLVAALFIDDSKGILLSLIDKGVSHIV